MSARRRGGGGGGGGGRLRRGAAGRPRDAQVAAAILDAALDLIIEFGYNRTSMEAVAARARVAKTTVYRRWPTKDDLMVDALARIKGDIVEPPFADFAIAHLAKMTTIPFREAADHFEAQAAKDGLVEASGHLKTVATSLFKIANDIRLLSSGPRCGIGEIRLPATQPGSSIMPGKVNPVMCEALMQVCAQVFGGDATITWAAAAGAISN